MASEMDRILEAAQKIRSTYPADLVAIACTQHFGKNLIEHFAEANDVSLANCLNLIDDTVFEYALSRGYSQAQVLCVKSRLCEIGTQLSEEDSLN